MVKSNKKPPTASKVFDFPHLLISIFCPAKLTKNDRLGHFFVQTVSGFSENRNQMFGFCRCWNRGIKTFAFLILYCLDF
jgi:hypothetical protein